MTEEKTVLGKPKKEYDKEYIKERRKQWKLMAGKAGFKSYGALLDSLVEISESKEKIAVLVETL